MATVAQVLGRHELIGNLVGREIRSRYKQSILGMTWSIVTPLVNTWLNAFLFSGLAGLAAGKNEAGQEIPYVLFVYVGTMFWNFFAAGLISGTDSMTSNLQLLTKVYFPREIFTLSAISARAVDFAFSFVVFIFFLFYFGFEKHFHISWYALLVPIILLIQLVLTLGLSLLLATINLFYRDVRFVISLVLQVWVYLTPVNYALAVFVARFHHHPVLQWMYLHLNPMTPLVMAYQDLILRGRMPDWAGIGASALFSVAFLLIGYAVFSKYEGRFAESI